MLRNNLFSAPARKFLLLFTCLATVYTTFGQTDTLSLYFGHDDDQLTASAEEQLTIWLRKIDPLLIAEIQLVGYTDHTGNRGYNQRLAQRRNAAVADWLNQYLPKAQWSISQKAKGEIPSSKNDTTRIPSHRKVVMTVIYDPTSYEVELNTQSTPQEKKQPEVVKEEEIDTTELFTTDTVEIGQKLTIPNIHFYPGRFFPLPSSTPTLNKLVKVMKDNPDLKIAIHGHICCVPSGARSQNSSTPEWQLSVERAKFVYNYLVQKGIDRDRLKYAGFGRSQPLVDPEITEEDRKKNRRVEIEILAK